jgi:cellulose synthase/poly-beta-1,6-N-acetylglucosamine synthase-like glycosyltransferase
MLTLLVLSFFLLVLFFLATYVSYYALIRIYSRKPWNLKIDIGHQPKVSVLIPTHNEEKNIGQKLSNICGVSYPKDLLEVIVVDDDSQDRTLSIVKDFVQNHNSIDVRLISQSPRAGKSAALNKALAISSHQIVIVSDADTLWDKNILEKALPYLSDPKIGAITGVGINTNEKESWVTRGEGKYLNIVSMMRTGESKLHSTIRFEGGFCAYKKEAFDHFDCETGADDSGTALSIVQKGWRTILVPEAVFYTWFPAEIKGKLRIKVRRANQLIALWIKCLRLMSRRQLRLPKRITIPQLLLFVVDPIILLTIAVVGLATVILYPFSLFSLALVLLVTGSLIAMRGVLLEAFVDNLILFYALLSLLAGKRFVSWENR